MKMHELDVATTGLPAASTTSPAMHPTLSGDAATVGITTFPDQSALSAVRDGGRIRIGGGMLRV